MRCRCVPVAPALVGVSLAGWLAVGCGPAQKPAGPAVAPVVTTEAVGDHADHDHGDHEGHDHAGHDDHEAEHEHPQTLAAGVAELEALTIEVAEKLAGDAREAADDAVHSAAHLIDDVRGLLAQETITAEAKEAAGKALDELYECYDKLDLALHAEAKEGSETVAEVHAAIATRVTEAVEALRQWVPKEEK